MIRIYSSPSMICDPIWGFKIMCLTNLGVRNSIFFMAPYTMAFPMINGYVGIAFVPLSFILLSYSIIPLWKFSPPDIKWMTGIRFAAMQTIKTRQTKLALVLRGASTLPLVTRNEDDAEWELQHILTICGEVLVLDMFLSYWHIN